MSLIQNNPNLLGNYPLTTSAISMNPICCPKPETVIVASDSSMIWFIGLIFVIILVLVIAAIVLWFNFRNRVVTHGGILWQIQNGLVNTNTSNRTSITDQFNANGGILYIGGTNIPLTLQVTLNSGVLIGSVFAIRNTGQQSIGIHPVNFTLTTGGNSGGTAVFPGAYAEFLIVHPNNVLRLS